MADFDGPTQELHLFGFFIHFGHSFHDGLGLFQQRLHARELGSNPNQGGKCTTYHPVCSRKSDEVGRRNLTLYGRKVNVCHPTQVEQYHQGTRKFQQQRRIEFQAGILPIRLQPSGEGTLFRACQLDFLHTVDEVEYQGSQLGRNSDNLLVLLPLKPKHRQCQQELPEDDGHPRHHQGLGITLHLEDINDGKYSCNGSTYQHIVRQVTQTAYTHDAFVQFTRCILHEEFCLEQERTCHDGRLYPHTDQFLQTHQHPVTYQIEENATDGRPYQQCRYWKDIAFRTARYHGIEHLFVHVRNQHPHDRNQAGNKKQPDNVFCIERLGHECEQIAHSYFPHGQCRIETEGFGFQVLFHAFGSHLHSKTFLINIGIGGFHARRYQGYPFAFPVIAQHRPYSHLPPLAFQLHPAVHDSPGIQNLSQLLFHCKERILFVQLKVIHDVQCGKHLPHRMTSRSRFALQGRLQAHFLHKLPDRLMQVLLLLLQSFVYLLLE